MAGKESKDICRQALDRYQTYCERERHNIDAAYEDLRFVYEDEHWHPKDKKQREEEGRPCLTMNLLPQFVQQVTGDMRQMKPSIKVVGTDNRADRKTADVLAGLIRYIENRSDAMSVYIDAGEAQVAGGIGHWKVISEYADDSTFQQELRIAGVGDHVSVAWGESILPTKEDAPWCIIPTDISAEEFKQRWPDARVEDFDDAESSATLGWYSKDYVRIGEYWVKEPSKKTLALLPDGSIDDLTEEPEERIEELRQMAPGIRIEKRDSYNVVRYLVTAAHVLEGPLKWKGRHIPVVPVIGQEKQIGRKIVRRSLIRPGKDPQRMFNYFCSAQAEVVGLQPKAPFIGTEKNFRKYVDEWSEANKRSLPFLIYEPDQANGGAIPNRVQPPVSSQGVTEGLMLALENVKRTIGIYDAGLGQKSNETSGKAILARQREGDIGTQVFIDNWIRSIKHTGKILIDLIPHIYDSERTIRIMGEDGKVATKEINKAVGIQADDMLSAMNRIENDVTIGAYDIVLDSGPSYTTKREEAKESMREFIQSAPEAYLPAIADLYAKAQDWPMADEIGKRMEALAPPAIQKLIARQKQELGEDEQPVPPSPQEQEQAQLQKAAVELELQNKSLANQKLQAEIAKTVKEASGEQDQQALAIETQKAAIELKMKEMELETKRQLAHLEIEIKLADLELKRAGMVQRAEQHAMEASFGAEKHRASLEQNAQAHQAKMSQRNLQEASV